MVKCYLTTPVCYVNAAPHIGSTYTTIAKEMQGFEVVLTTGTDERGLTIQRTAEKAGQTPESMTARRFINVDTPWGVARMKVTAQGATHEFDGCRKGAEAKGAPLRALLAQAQFTYIKEF